MNLKKIDIEDLETNLTYIQEKSRKLKTKASQLQIEIYSLDSTALELKNVIDKHYIKLYGDYGD